MNNIGIRELQAATASFVKSARDGKDYVVTWHGQEAAALVSIKTYRRWQEEQAMSEERAVYNTEQPAPEEADRLIGLFAPRLVNQVLEQCWQDKRTARRVLLAALLRLEEGQP